MNTKHKKRRFSISLKLNIIIISCILVVSIGLTAISYTVYCKKVNSLYYDKAEKVAAAIAEGYVAFGGIEDLWNAFNTDEFREVRRQAIEANDDGIIEDWMRNHFAFNGGVTDSLSGVSDKEKEQYNLYGFYIFFAEMLKEAEDTFGIKSAYMQYVKDGVTYNFIDPDEPLRIIGTEEEPIEAFSEYKGNETIPATIYQYNGEWLCTACEGVALNEDDNTINVCQVGVDIDMNDVVTERYYFLLNSALFIIILMVLAIIVSVIITRKLIIKPIKELSDGTTGFAAGDKGFNYDDVINLPINSKDEIGDLYTEIQSMQNRIIENANKLTKITAERERVNAELDMATNIQSSMIPNEFPAFPDKKEFELYASMDPAKEVGGDFYDFFMIDDEHLCFLIADVSGKGIPAALFMMSSMILIKYRARMGGTPGEILRDVNAQISLGNKSKMFVTVWMGILDVNTGALTCTNAGHEYPAVRTEDGLFQLVKDKHGVMAGISSKAKYKDYELKLSPGDAIFVYTDGVVEANNDLGKMYRRNRLVDSLNEVASKSPKEILGHIRDDVNVFANGAEQYDDITMLCLEYKGKERA